MNPEEYRLVVSSGPTREWIDPVRYISNPSSGRTGWAIATKGVSLFKEVIFISGPVISKYSSVKNATNIHVDTTEDMAKAVHEWIGDKTILIMAAAPADFTARKASDHKIKKTSSESHHIELLPTRDILKSLKGKKFNSFIKVGFAAETNDVENYALKKLKDKKLDYICANQVFKQNMGFGENINTLTIYSKKGSTKTIGPGDKKKLAGQLIKYLIRDIV